VKKQHNHIVLTGLLVLLFILSFFKDNLTPDYLNSPAAAFLDPALNAGTSRIYLIVPHRVFWIKAVCYSALFSVLPYTILRKSSNPVFARYVLYCFAAIGTGLYILILANNRLLDTAIVPKINRFYHSPILTLFLVAAYSINNRLKDDH
jgi:hypothetical protein